MPRIHGLLEELEYLKIETRLIDEKFASRLQFINSHIMLNNRCVLQQHHVDCKITDAFLKKGAKQHTDGWDAQI